MEKKKKNVIIFGIIILFLIFILGYFVTFIENKFFLKKEGFSLNNTSSSSSKKEKLEIQKEIQELGLEPHLGFCESHRNSGKGREEACSKLSKENCAMTSCCVYTDQERCVAGSSRGTLYKTKNGKPLKVETYHHYGKCYGKKC